MRSIEELMQSMKEYRISESDWGYASEKACDDLEEKFVNLFSELTKPLVDKIKVLESQLEELQRKVWDND